MKLVLNIEHQHFHKELKGIVEILSDMELLKMEDGSYSSFYITYKGWERIDLLNIKKEKFKKVFIAMWFDKSMVEYKDAIMSAIRETKYWPVIINEKEHNNQIVPEILYEINTSAFIVADITGGRNGVYYEAGYAQGVGKEVILTLHNNSEAKPHFDVDQKNQIRYDSAKELTEKLVKRIKATVGEADR